MWADIECLKVFAAEVVSNEVAPREVIEDNVIETPQTESIPTGHTPCNILRHILQRVPVLDEHPRHPGAFHPARARHPAILTSEQPEDLIRPSDMVASYRCCAI